MKPERKRYISGEYEPLVGSVWKSKAEYERTYIGNKDTTKRTYVLVFGKTRSGRFAVHITREYDYDDRGPGPFQEWAGPFLTSWFMCINDNTKV